MLKANGEFQDLESVEFLLSSSPPRPQRLRGEIPNLSPAFEWFFVEHLRQLCKSVEDRLPI